MKSLFDSLPVAFMALFSDNLSLAKKHNKGASVAISSGSSVIAVSNLSRLWSVCLVVC